MFSGTDDDVFIDIIGESAQVGAELRAQAFQKKNFCRLAGRISTIHTKTTLNAGTPTSSNFILETWVENTYIWRQSGTKDNFRNTEGDSAEKERTR